MGTLSVNKLAGLSLIFGSLIAFVFFLIEPGGILIDSADPSDSIGTITAKGANSVLTSITNILSIAGLALTIFGLYAILSNVSSRGNGKSLTQMGFFMMLVGIISWILAGGVDLMLADAQTPEQIGGSVPVYLVGSALLYVGGLTIGLGSIFFALGLSTRADFNQIIAHLAALVSLVILVCFLIGILSNSNLDTFITIARGLYVLWVLWLIYLGFGLLNKPDPLASD